MNGIICSIKSKNSLQETFNITYGNSRTINRLTELITDNFPKVQVSYKKRDKLMPLRGTLSISKAEKLIKFKSKWPLEKGYLKYINWYKSIFKN